MNIIILILLVIVIVVGFILTSPEFKGYVGEKIIELQAKKNLDENYIILNNTTLPVDKHHTTQIDHIIVSPYGIFVIETKNYKGWIFGGEHQKKWTQKLNKSYSFQNPLHQNYKHTQVLGHILKDIVDPTFIYSLVIFTPSATFKTQMPKNVFNSKAWIDYVKSFQDEVISTIKVKQICLKIEKEALTRSFQTSKQHVKNLKKRTEQHKHE